MTGRDDAPGTGGGLCEVCRHVRRVKSQRGSVFLLCERALTDSSFKKYPPLPVRECRGYEPREGVTLFEDGPA